MSICSLVLHTKDKIYSRKNRSCLSTLLVPNNFPTPFCHKWHTAFCCVLMGSVLHGCCMMGYGSEALICYCRIVILVKSVTVNENSYSIYSFSLVFRRSIVDRIVGHMSLQRKAMSMNTLWMLYYDIQP